MFALGEFGFISRIDGELYGLFVGDVSSFLRGFDDFAFGIDAYLHNYFSFLIKGVGRFWQFAMYASSGKAPAVSSGRAVPDGVALLSGSLAVSRAVAVPGIAEE